MDWVQALGTAIEYIEAHLEQPMSCAQIANHVYSSSAHFQRVFGLLTGMTLGEYIRNRRVSLAGQELTRTGAKVIDVALKYGYESPESFAKAFVRFHGITPKQAQAYGASLRSFNRLLIKMIMEGGNIMDYRIERQGAFQVAVRSGCFNEETSKAQIPAFWDAYYEGGFHRRVGGSMGICGAPIEDAENGAFLYGIGDRFDGGEAPEGFQLWQIPAGTWAIFKCTGAMPAAIQQMWKRIYAEWLPQAQYELLPGYDFEYYPQEGDPQSDTYVCEIRIRVQQK